jgi:hypothetical protein
VIADDDQTDLLLAYDDEYLYAAAVMRYSERPEIADWALAIPRGTRTNGAWRVPCIELFIDPDCDRESCFQVVMNLAGWISEGHGGGWGSKLGSGAWWESGVEFEYVVGEREAVVEARVPLANLGGAPNPGDRWVFQAARILGGFSCWSHMYEHGGFHCMRQYGSLVFE